MCIASFDEAIRWTDELRDLGTSEAWGLGGGAAPPTIRESEFLLRFKSNELGVGGYNVEIVSWASRYNLKMKSLVWYLENLYPPYDGVEMFTLS